MARKFTGVTDALLTYYTIMWPVVSYSFWALRNGTGGGGFGEVWKKGSGANLNDNLFFNPTGTVMRYNRGWSTISGGWTFPAPSQDVWHHFLLSYNSSSTSPPEVWVDGVAQTVSTVTTPSGSANFTTDAYFIGNEFGVDDNWNGELEEFAIWRHQGTGQEANFLRTRRSAAFLRNGLMSLVPISGGTNAAAEKDLIFNKAVIVNGTGSFGTRGLRLVTPAPRRRLKVGFNVVRNPFFPNTSFQRTYRVVAY